MKVPSTRWYRGRKKPEEKEELKKMLQTAKPILETLAEMLEDDLKGIDKEQSNKENYTLPAYSEFQADCNATKRTYRKVIKLITLGE